MYQQDLTTDPFGKTYEENAVSPKVAIGGGRTQVSTTKGNESNFERKKTHKDLIILTKD
jgi:hypothetical protein